MSISEFDIIFGRIKAANPESPIAVFKVFNNDKLDAVFASTVITNQKIKTDKHCLVGVYDKDMNLNQVQQELRRAIQA